MPDEIYINNVNQSVIINYYVLNNTENEIKLIFNNNFNSTANMFFKCDNINEIVLSHFDTSQVANMESMFWYCESLIILNLTNFNTSKVINMNSMFSFCKNLNSLYLSSFDTSSTKEMGRMFSVCEKLEYLDLTKFNTSQVTYMGSMFDFCEKLEYLDLTNFNTSQVTNMGRMFMCCCKLTSLNLSNFDTSNVEYMSNMFDGCSELEYLDFSNLNTLKINNDYQIAHFLSGEFKYINLQNAKLNNYSLPWVGIEVEERFICGTSNLILNSVVININCNNNSNDNNNYICYNKYNNEYNKYICEICNNDYYQIKNDSNNNKSFINCYKSPEGYYLNKSELYPYPKLCYSTCKLCDKGGNNDTHNCLECKTNYEPISISSKYFNCLCNNYYYIDEITNETICLPNKTCPYDYNKLIFNTNHCINNCTKNSIYKYEFNNICYDEYSYNITINNLFTTNLIINQITTNDIKYNEIMCDSYNSELIMKELNEINHNKTQFENFKKYLLNIYNTNYILNNHDLDIKLENNLITISSTLNQKNNLYKNKTSIDLGLCENKLKRIYNISLNNSLFLFIIEKKEEGYLIPKVEYELYYPLYSKELIKLNLSICKNMKMDISLPVSINDNIDKYNKSSEYYNNICSKTTSDKGTDISLTERKNIFINNNMTLCEEDCDLVDYNYTTEKARCSCFVKISFPFIDDIKFDKKKY